MEVGQGNETGAIIAKDHKPGDETSVEQPDRDDNGRWFRYQVVLWSPETGFCIQRRWTRDEAYAKRQNEIGFGIRFDRNTGAPRLECPRDATPAAPPTSQQLAEATWQEVKNLPVPTLKTEPAHAITGKKVYLQIAGERTWSQTVDNPIGDDVTITASSDYVVDWGDDTATTTTRSQGGPWPDGDVTHTYTDAAPSRPITVTQRWTATWHAGNTTGILTRLETRAEPLELEVRQLQAVRDR